MKLDGKGATGATTVNARLPVTTELSAGFVAETVTVTDSPTGVAVPMATVAMRPVGSVVMVILVVSEDVHVGTTEPTDDPEGSGVAVNTGDEPGLRAVSVAIRGAPLR